MNKYQPSKKAKLFAVAFPIACLLTVFSIVVFANLKFFAPPTRARTVERAAVAPVADDMPILISRGTDIYKISEDGATEQRLTNTPEFESLGKWSPDGRKISYRKSAEGINQIWVMNADGNNQTLISDEAIPSAQAQWSPNGQKILFIKTEAGGTDQIWVMNPDGSNKTRLTMSGTNDHRPEWSPDGSKIAFGQCNADYLACDVVVMNADGSNQTNLTFANMNDDDIPKWTPDGSKIVYEAGNAAGDFNVFIMNVDGTNIQPLTNGTSPRVYLPAGTWYRVNSSNQQFVAAQFGIAEDKPLIGDFDGDGKSDLAVFRPSNGTWYRINSATDTFSAAQFGANGDQPVAADYDGDGKTDLAVRRPGITGAILYRILSSNGSFVTTQFGLNEHIPAPADFDGDGRADLVLFDPASGTWYLQRSTAGYTSAQFGAQGDIPTPNAFIR